MKRAFNIIFLCALLCAFCSCRQCKDIIVTNTHQQTDSVSTVIKERVVEVHDTTVFFIPVESVSSVGQQNSHLETSMATSDAYVDSMGILRHTLNNKEQEIVVPVNLQVPVSDTTHFESHSKVDSVFIPQPYPVEVIVEKPLSWLQKTLMYLGVFTIAVALIYIVYQIKKKHFLP